MFLHAYHTIFISIVVWISCITAVVLLGMLIFRFIQWFKTSNDRLILSYAFALGLIILNCGIILAYINTTLESRPKLIPSTYASVNYGVTVQFHLNDAYRATSFASFIAIWAASIFSLIGYSKKIGRIKFCLAWSIDSRPMSSKYVMEMKSKYGIRDGLWLADEFVQCPDCKRWFENENFKANHTCITPVLPLQYTVIDGCCRIIIVIIAIRMRIGNVISKRL